MALLVNTVFLFLVLSVCSIFCSDDNGTFFYFAYGSNLLDKRIKLNNPTAIFTGPAELKDYRLDFFNYIKYWEGAVATIVPHPGHVVWGALWTLDKKEMDRLDKQEGVDVGLYFALNKTVTMPGGISVEARTYQATKLPSFDDLPMQRQPSNTYLQVIFLGAVESKLPADYIGSLLTINPNGQFANETIRKSLGYPFY
ncbi:gamma-glutamylcyclotransferase-like [Amyelois transitella]|uniref:gamma-glutamylcyclotransferase-like n=1 Tax=Amyelois transitella TaxID=680683 RepID=UPI00298FB001|nr:gamma-glutamylcyclotransferase-like [Amyelois transitella]